MQRIDSDSYCSPSTAAKENKLDANLPAKKDLMIGYGDSVYQGDITFESQVGSTDEIAFLKLFVSVQGVDLSFIEQESPFDDIPVQEGLELDEDEEDRRDRKFKKQEPRKIQEEKARAERWSTKTFTLRISKS